MRELKREEYGMISGGQATTDLPPVHVVAIDPSSMTNLGSLAMGNGLSPTQAHEACLGIGVAGKVGAKGDPSVKTAGKLCDNAVNTVVNGYKSQTDAMHCIVDLGGSYNSQTHVCIP